MQVIHVIVWTSNLETMLKEWQPQPHVHGVSKSLNILVIMKTEHRKISFEILLNNFSRYQIWSKPFIFVDLDAPNGILAQEVPTMFKLLTIKQAQAGI